MDNELIFKIKIEKGFVSSDAREIEEFKNENIKRYGDNVSFVEILTIIPVVKTNEV